MEPREAGVIYAGKFGGRGLKELIEILPLDSTTKRIGRLAVGGILTALPILKKGMRRDYEILSAVAGADMVVDEVVDMVFEMLAKPSKATVTVTPTVVPAKTVSKPVEKTF